MKSCENCGTEHDGTYGSGRFCSTKCSRGFSTKNKRLEINEKISKSLTKEPLIKVCEKCKKDFKAKRSSRFCSRSCKSKSLSAESRNKISEKMKIINAGENNPMFGKSPKNTKRILVYSDKHNGAKNFYVRSSYEELYVKELNESETVVSFIYEPVMFKCNYVSDNKKRTYQPDFFVTEQTKTYVTEVKAKWQKDSEDTIQKKTAFINSFDIDYILWIK